jgi:hypothetical protein
VITGWKNRFDRRFCSESFIKTNSRYSLWLEILSWIWEHSLRCFYKGEIEDRIKNIAQELKSIPKSVLIIEEFHSLFGSHGSDSGIVNLLKSELSNGLTLISTSTIEEYTKN